MFDGRMQPAKWIEQMIAHADNSAPDLQRAIAELQCKLNERTSELDEALAQQVATADILQVINSSRGDLAPVFDAILEKAHNLCGVAYGSLQIYDGERFRAVAVHNLPERFANLLRQGFRGSDHPVGRALLDGDRLAHISDCAQIDYPTMRAAVELAGIRTALFVPLRRDDALLGQIVAARREVRPFTEKEIALLESFAAQAVIAIENARLLGELRQRTEDLSESLQHQTATADVLKVISRSTFDLQTVFETLAESAVRLCSAERGLVFRFDGQLLRFAVGHNVSPEFRDFLEGNPIVPGRNSNAGRAALERRTVHNPDVQNDPEYNYGGSRVDPYRTVLAVPMLKGGELFGVFVIYRHEVRPFTDSQIALMETFADQAVIAIENTRLISETREALEQQTATGDVLKIISRSSVDLETVLDTLVETVARLCRADQAVMFRRRDDVYHLVASRGLSEEAKEFQRTHPLPTDRGSMSGRVMLERRAVHIPDVLQDPEYTYEGQKVTGYRTLLGVPLLREETLVGTLVVTRTRVQPFTDKEIELVRTFADQAVIAIENARLFEELRESLEQQTATAEVLQVINTSQGDLKPVFDAILDKALRLSHSAFGIMRTFDGEHFQLAAEKNVPQAYVDFTNKRLTTLVGAHTLGATVARVITEKRVHQIVDAKDHDLYRQRDPMRRAVVDLAGARTILFVPLLRDDVVRGTIMVFRTEVQAFSDKEIALLRNFAAQAVIAMDNARLIGELRERQAELARSVDELTATGDVLKIISRSSVDLPTVLDALVETVARLCRADQASVFRWRDDKYHLVANFGFSAEAMEFAHTHPLPAGRGSLSGRVASERRAVHIPDVLQDPEYAYSEAQKLIGYRTMLGVPLLREDALLGIFTIHRMRVDPFTHKEIELVQTFADQAVIAIENARLFDELRERQAELARSVDELTATGDVLKIISRSSVDLPTVLDALVETVARLCRADLAHMFRRRDDMYHLVATRGGSEFLRTHPLAPDRGTVTGRAALERRAVHIPDVLQDPEYAYREGQRLVGFRTMLGVPLLRGETLVGILTLNRMRVDPYTTKEIELATSFADQAVIAIENTRLFDELRERQAELARSVDELTATSDVLKIISRSSVELETVLDTLVETVARLSRADQAAMFRRRDDMYHLVAARGFSEEQKEFVLTHPLESGRGSLSGRVALERRAVHIPDVLQDPEYTSTGQQKIVGFRTMLGVPLLREDTLIGILVVHRTRVDPFTSKEIELIQTFADQAVIAIENARLFDELRDRQAELRVTFDNMGDGVAMFDAEPRLVSWNRNFQEIIDLPEAVLALRPTYTDYIRTLAERGEFGTEGIAAELSRRLQDTDREVRLERTRPDGRVIEVRRNPVPAGGFVLIYSDITERKRAEAAISAARDAAETALRELQTAQASLLHAQKMAALGQLTAGIAHEIKNPLNFVNNFASLSAELLDELKEATAPATAALGADKRAEIDETIEMLTGNLGKIVEHGRRADGIVKSMLAHSRGGSGDWQAVDLNGLVEDALNLAYHGARAQDQSFNITMERDLDRNLAPIEVLPQDVTRVFLNLISNGFYAANKRSSTGDGAFRPVLRITTRDFGNAVEVGVRDNGVGIPPQHQEKLFQPFFTTKPTGEGIGLGLSISYEIITQRHGGTITVDSEVGDFTEFTVRLPRRRRAVAG
jgi:two-component system, NtrC family, sensor kinase